MNLFQMGDPAGDGGAHTLLTHTDKQSIYERNDGGAQVISTESVSEQANPKREESTGYFGGLFGGKKSAGADKSEGS